MQCSSCALQNDGASAAVLVSQLLARVDPGVHPARAWYVYVVREARKTPTGAMDEAFKSKGIFILHVGARTSAVRGPKGCQIRAEVLIDPLLKADMATFQELVSQASVSRDKPRDIMSRLSMVAAGQVDHNDGQWLSRPHKCGFSGRFVRCTQVQSRSRT